MGPASTTGELPLPPSAPGPFPSSLGTSQTFLSGQEHLGVKMSCAVASLHHLKWKKSLQEEKHKLSFLLPVKME